jgi:hypothetical protein
LGIGTIEFTGGEPLLFPDEIIRLVERAHKNGQKTFIVTNATWAESHKAAEKTVGFLKNAGLQQMDVSYDEFHSKSGAKIEQVAWVVRECQKRNIKIRIRRHRHPIQTKAGIKAAKEVFRLRCETKVGLLYRYGRAKRTLPRDKVRYPVTPLEKSPMCSEIGKLLYMWHGDLVPCCGGAYNIRTEDRNHANYLKMGNIYEDTLEESIRRVECNLFLAVLGTCGPGGFMILSQGYENNITWPEEVECACDFCVWAVCDDEFQRWFQAIEQDRDSILLRLQKFYGILDRWGLMRIKAV